MRVPGIQYQGQTYVLVQFLDRTIELVCILLRSQLRISSGILQADHIQAATEAYLDAIGIQFSLQRSEVADVVVKYIIGTISALGDTQMAKHQAPGSLDHQNPIASQCLDKVPLDDLNPIRQVRDALINGNIHNVEDGPKISPVPGSVYMYIKDNRRWTDKLKWSFNKNRTSTHGTRFWIHHGTTNGYLSEHCTIVYRLRSYTCVSPR